MAASASDDELNSIHFDEEPKTFACSCKITRDNPNAGLTTDARRMSLTAGEGEAREHGISHGPWLLRALGWE